MVFRIKWRKDVANAYTFGSYISFLGDKVVFDNALMSPGFSITSWSSQTKFQSQRTQPELPLLKRGHVYQVFLRAAVLPENSLYVKVTYFDRLGKEIGSDILKDQTWIFRYPSNAFHYTIDLLNAGCEYLVFDYLQLFENRVEQRIDVNLEDLAVYFPKENDDLHVVFLEPDVLTPRDLPMAVLERLGNVVLVGHHEAMSSYYLTQEFEQKLSDYLWFYHDNQLKNMHFIAYGSTGALAALHYGAKFSSPTYLGRLIEHKEVYQKKLASRQIKPGVLTSIFERLTYTNAVTYYGQRQEQKKLPLLEACFDQAHQLVNLPLLKENEG